MHCDREINFCFSSRKRSNFGDSYIILSNPEKRRL